MQYPVRSQCFVLFVVAACSGDADGPPPAPAYAGAAGRASVVEAACPAAPACPEAAVCPPAPACPEAAACPPAPAAPSYATEYALRAPFCRTSDGKVWGCETFEASGEPAGNVTYTAGGVAWSCVLRTPMATAPDGLGFGPRYTAPLPCGADNACDVTTITSGSGVKIEHHAGVCLAQTALAVAP